MNKNIIYSLALLTTLTAGFILYSDKAHASTVVCTHNNQVFGTLNGSGSFDQNSARCELKHSMLPTSEDDGETNAEVHNASACTVHFYTQG